MGITGYARPGISIASVAAVLLIVLLSSFSENAAAATKPKFVKGYVWDSAGTPLENSSIVVNIRYAATNLTRSSNTTETDSDGYYQVGFRPNQWDVGDIIEVIACYHTEQENNYSIATFKASAPYAQWVNVTFPFEIPEFGSISGMLTAGGILASIAFVTLVAPRRKRR